MSDCHAAAVILAAGASTRLGGSPKALLPFAGCTIIETVLAKARQAGLGPLVVVVGSDGDTVRATLNRSLKFRVRVVANPHFPQGIAGSVAAGVGAVATEDVEAVAVLLADEPGIEVDSIRHVVREWCQMRPAAIRAMYLDRPGHPVVLSRSVFALVTGLPPSARVLPALTRAGREVGTVTLASRAPIDVDTAEDYQLALRRSPQAPSVPAGTFPDAAAPREFPRR